MFVNLLNGAVNVPLNKRSQEQKNGLIQFLRIKKDLKVRKINNNDCLFDKRKEVLVTDDVTGKVKSEIKKSMGSGARHINYAMKRKFTGVSERIVQKALQKSKRYFTVEANFTNKSPLRAIEASYVFEKVQVDLVDKRRKPIELDGQIYKYILTMVDCFSRFVFVRPLQEKSAKAVKTCLQPLFLEHGFPKILQCDNGTEFKGTFASFLKKHRVLMNSRPYHPQSQGKVSNFQLKYKLKYLGNKKGSNWARVLPKIAHSMNTQHKEALAYKTPLEVYYSRTKGSVDQLRETVTAASKRCVKRMMSQNYKGLHCSIYHKGDRVLLKLPIVKSRIPTKTVIVEGKILKRGRNFDRYKVQFRLNNSEKEQWVSVERITSLTKETEEKRKLSSKRKFEQMYQSKLHRQKYYIVKDTSEEELVCEQNDCDMFLKDVSITFNPSENGNSQFHSVSYGLASFGIGENDADVPVASNEINDDVPAAVNGKDDCIPNAANDDISYVPDFNDDIPDPAVINPENDECIVPVYSNDNNNVRNILDPAAEIEERNTTVLPPEILTRIIEETIKIHPPSKYNLLKVNNFFEQTVLRIGLPRIFINPQTLYDVPKPVSVRKLIRTFGSGSGVVQEVKNIISCRDWTNAWLFLREIQGSWFEIRNVVWRN